MPVLNTIQYKQCLHLAVSKTQCIIFRSDLHNFYAKTKRLKVAKR